MELSLFDISVFIAFIDTVVGFSLFKSRKEETGKDFFLAGRSLTWPLIGFSLIAANISTEQFVGMNGQATGNVGLAVASYDWIAPESGHLQHPAFEPENPEKNVSGRQVGTAGSDSRNIR